MYRKRSGKKGHKSRTDQGNASSCHQLLHSLGLGAGVVIAIPFHKVNNTPNAKARPECYDQRLQHLYRTVEKFHRKLSSLNIPGKFPVATI